MNIGDWVRVFNYEEPHEDLEVKEVIVSKPLVPVPGSFESMEIVTSDGIKRRYPDIGLCQVGYKCLDHGFVRLVDHMGNDAAIVQAARTSYGGGQKSPDEDKKLLRYLMRHRHTTPFEMVEFKFHAKMPIFVARQWVRHRMASINEVSLRYTEAKDEFFMPEEWREQSKANKQGGDLTISEPMRSVLHQMFDRTTDSNKKTYDYAVENDVSKELARIVLPVSAYTEWYWKIDLHNLLHFLALRCDSHAQYEIRVYADAMLKLIEPIVPLVVEAWNDYHPMRGGILFSRQEGQILKMMLKSVFPFDMLKTDIPSRLSDREKDEFTKKLERIFNEDPDRSTGSNVGSG